MAAKVSKTIETVIGKIARPKNVWIVPDMPKTRSGKIMRRVIASVSNFADVGDVTTLANPEVVESIRHHVQAAKLAHGEVPRELTGAEEAEIKAFGGEWSAGGPVLPGLESGQKLAGVMGYRSSMS
jgi:acetyl-CoA synthetase